jgi:ATP-dependent DNA helicase RecQ
MSCIFRTGQRFGVNYLIEVLTGKEDERIRRNAHDQLSTFGIGRDLSAEQWRSVYRQLVAAGLVAVDIEGHGALQLTEQSRPVLRGERTLRLRRDPERRPAKVKGEGRAARAETPLDPEATALWERLRSYRRELALEQGVPPYVVFNDATLRELVTYRPRDLDELSRISGVGVVKLERYGAGFLALLAAHAAEHGRPPNVPLLPESPLRAVAPAGASAGGAAGGRVWEEGLNDTARGTLDLLRTGLAPAQIAERRALKISTIYTHLSRCIEEGELALGEIVTLTDDELQAIEFAFTQLTADSPLTLKPVFDAFQGQYDYGLLRCVRAAMGRA